MVYQVRSLASPSAPAAGLSARRAAPPKASQTTLPMSRHGCEAWCGQAHLALVGIGVGTRIQHCTHHIHAVHCHGLRTLPPQRASHTTSRPSYETRLDLTSHAKCDSQLHMRARRCDPLDGTTNFVHSFPFVCVCIGLVIKKRVVVGVVHNPVLNETFTGECVNWRFVYG